MESWRVTNLELIGKVAVNICSSFHLLDIGTGSKRLAAAGQHDGSYIIIFIECLFIMDDRE